MCRTGIDEGIEAIQVADADRDGALDVCRVASYFAAPVVEHWFL
jgi:hypothetical protein